MLRKYPSARSPVQKQRRPPVFCPAPDWCKPRQASPVQMQSMLSVAIATIHAALTEFQGLLHACPWRGRPGGKKIHIRSDQGRPQSHPRRWRACSIACCEPSNSPSSARTWASVAWADASICRSSYLWDKLLGQADPRQRFCGIGVARDQRFEKDRASRQFFIPQLLPPVRGTRLTRIPPGSNVLRPAARLQSSAAPGSVVARRGDVARFPRRDPTASAGHRTA